MATSIKSTFLPVPVSEPTSAAFIKAARSFYARRLLKTLFRPRVYRTPLSVQHNYDKEALSSLQKLEQGVSWDEYIYGAPVPEDFYVDNVQVKFGRRDVPRRKIADLLIAQVSAITQNQPGTIVEFGSGTGRNILLLKKHLPHCNFIGLELSPQNVLLSRRAADKFGIEATFHQCDVSTHLPELPKDIRLVYSVHALEMMPRIFASAVDNMMSITSKQALLLEPIAEYYPWSLRHILARFRAYDLDRLRGLRGYVQKRGWTIREARLLPVSDNPLNPTVLMILER